MSTKEHIFSVIYTLIVTGFLSYIAFSAMQCGMHEVEKKTEIRKLMIEKTGIDLEKLR